MLKVLAVFFIWLTLAESRLHEDGFDGCRDTSPKHSFSFVDYLVLGIMLVVSCAIGTFYGFFAKKQTTSDDFLLGGSNMGTLPMSLSLAASFITAIELLGNPAEMYKFGTQFWTICLAFLFVVPITTRFYLPVYMKLRLTSSFEYLELRFNRQVRLFAAVMYAIQMTLYTSVTVYAPAIALSHVTGMGVVYAVSLVYCVCIFYSSQGGMKAVIMTDTFQAAVLIVSLLLVMVLGQVVVGSVSEVFDVSAQCGRIELSNLNPSLTERHSIWTQVVGGVAYWVPMFCSNQASIQKYLAVKTSKQVRIALWVSAISLVVIYTINFYTGMIVFAEYYECDPLNKFADPSLQILKSKDEILPYYVMNVLGRYNGIPGFFVAGIFAASLGTVASALNSLAAITMKDFLEAGLNMKVADNKGAILSKWISITFGAISFLLIFVVRQMDSVLKAALTFNGIVGGINLGLFSLGMFLPWINSKGALAGSLVSLVFVSWVGINSQLAETAGYVSECDKPAYNGTEGVCLHAVPCDSNSDVFILYRISYMWYSAIGLSFTIIAGVVISWCTGFNDPCRVSADLLSPPFRRFYSKFSNSTKERLHLPIETKEEIQINQITPNDKTHFERVSET